MARISIRLPDRFNFSTHLRVRISDLNYGNHLGNDALLSMIHEARMRFLASLGYSEIDLGGVSLIMSDVAIEYKGEGFHGDQLKIEIAAYDFSGKGFDIGYRISRDDGSPIAKAKTGMVCFDYEERKVKPLPEQARKKLEA